MVYLNSDQLPPNTVLQGFDICIIGAGAAGIPMARRLIGSGKSVLLLAGGKDTDRGLPDARQQAIYRGNVGPLLHKIDPIFSDRSRLHMYGGTTNHFGFWARTLDPLDFVARPGFRDAHWPISRDELLPYYQEANYTGRYAHLSYDDLNYWRNALYAECFDSMPDAPLTGAIMHAQYAEELHDFQVQFGKELRDASNITVLFNAYLTHIETDSAGGHVSRLQCASIQNGRAGHRFNIEAGTYVLAMGGVENVRFLKLANNLGNNARDHLGRGFMMHPLITSAAKVHFKKPVPLINRAFFREQTICLRHPQKPGEPYVPVSAPAVDPAEVLNYSVFNAWGVLMAKPEALIAENSGHFRVILRFNPAGDEAYVNINWEQIPNETSIVTLDPERVDPVFGLPSSYVDWRLTDADKHTARTALKLVEAYLRPHGLDAYEHVTDLSGGAEDWTCIPHEGAMTTGDHHMGAIRMSATPEAGLVNPDGCLHSVDNLYVSGTAVFPTGGWANPTLTLIALAIRLADHLKTR